MDIKLTYFNAYKCKIEMRRFLVVSVQSARVFFKSQKNNYGGYYEEA